MLIALVEAFLAIGLGAIFLAAAVPKLRHPRGFAVTVIAFAVLPPGLSGPVARFVPVAEALVGMMLVTGTLIRIAGVAACGLCLAFGVAVAINVARGRELDCGCFGKGGGRKVGPQLLIEDIGLAGSAVIVVALSGGWMSLATWSVLRAAPVSSSASPILAIGAGCLLVLLASTFGRKGRQSPRGAKHRGEIQL